MILESGISYFKYYVNFSMLQKTFFCVIPINVNSDKEALLLEHIHYAMHAVKISSNLLLSINRYVDLTER